MSFNIRPPNYLLFRQRSTTTERGERERGVGCDTYLHGIEIPLRYHQVFLMEVMNTKSSGGQGLYTVCVCLHT